VKTKRYSLTNKVKMNEYLEEARDELKRVDHLVYVSLKYTRTVDVIKSVVDRIINAFDFVLLALLNYLKEKKKIKEFPQSPGMKVELIAEKFNNQELNSYLDFYLMLRKISRAQYTKREEYRRHVTMIASLDNEETVEVDIDILKEYYDKTKQFLDFVAELLEK